MFLSMRNGLNQQQQELIATACKKFEITGADEIGK